MTDTLIGVPYRVARIAGLIAIVLLIGTGVVLEPQLQEQGYGPAVLVIYAISVPVLVWSLIEDIRRLRN